MREITFNFDKEYLDNKQIEDFSNSLESIIKKYSTTEEFIFEELLSTFLYDGEYKRSFEGEVYRLSETLQKVYQDINVSNILQNVIDYVAIFGCKYCYMLTNYHYQSQVWWIKKIIK